MTGGGRGVWALVGAGAAIGGTAVWGLALAARIGVLRMLLELFPRSTWDTVTWGLIPALMLAPPVLQGIGVACLADARPARLGRSVAGSLVGTLAAAAVIGAALLMWVRRLPPPALAAVAQGAPEVLAPAFGIVVLAGWLGIAGRLEAVRWLRWGAVPIAVVIVALAWVRAHGPLMAVSYVLDRPEMNAFFAAVAVGGGAGSAGAVLVGRTRRGAAHRAGEAQPAGSAPPQAPAQQTEGDARHGPG